VEEAADDGITDVSCGLKKCQCSFGFGIIPAPLNRRVDRKPFSRQVPDSYLYKILQDKPSTSYNVGIMRMRYGFWVGLA
jgi:hypothetical protein